MNTPDKVEILCIWVFNYVGSNLTIEEREMVEAVSEQVKDQGTNEKMWSENFKCHVNQCPRGSLWNIMS